MRMPSDTSAVDVAVVGAGLAGLSAARALADAGHAVVVFEKSRGAGGRTATRRGPDGLRFDHGAPVLHDGRAPLAGLPALARHELVLPGGRRTETVGAGAANAPAKALAAGLDLRPGVRVAAIAADGARWVLQGEHGEPLGDFGAVVVAVPAPQAVALLAAAPAMAAAAASVAYEPCWAAMAAWGEPLALGFTAARDAEGLAWAVAEAPKPGRAPGERWVLLADAAVSAAHLEGEADGVASLLLGRFERLAGPLPPPVHLTAHRWRFSRPLTPLPQRLLRAGTLLAAGDWCGGSDAGAAVRSGRAAAAALRS